VWLNTYGYLPSHMMPLSSNCYQNTAWWQRHVWTTCPRLLPAVVERPAVKLATSWIESQCVSHCTALPGHSKRKIYWYCVVNKTGWLVDPECRPSFSELAQEFSKMASDPGRYLLIEVCTFELPVLHLLSSHHLLNLNFKYCIVL